MSGAPRSRRAGGVHYRFASLIALALLLFSLAGCATLSARRHYAAGVDAESRGDLTTALTSYQQAYEQAPETAEYAAAFERIKKAAAEQHVAFAERALKDGDLAKAEEHYRAALGFVPGDRGYAVALGLIQIETAGPDPEKRYQRAAQLLEEFPNHKQVRAAAERAAADAIEVFVAQAYKLADQGKLEAAFSAFEIVRGIDPKHDALSSGRYRRALSFNLESKGDDAAARGDHNEAKAQYEAALDAERRPELIAKARREDRKVRALEARALAKQREAELWAKRAHAMAKKGDVDGAGRLLVRAVRDLKMEEPSRAAFIEAVEALQKKRPDEARASLKIVATAEHAKVVDTINLLTNVVAKRVYEEGKRIGVDDPALGYETIDRLAPFQKRLNGFSRTKNKLRGRAFTHSLRAAVKSAETGDRVHALERLEFARSLSTPSTSIASDIDRALKLLEENELSGSKAAFAELKKKSRLARTGVRVTDALVLAELLAGAKAAESDGKVAKALSLLDRVLELRPGHPVAVERKASLVASGVATNVEHMERETSEQRLGTAYLFARRVLRLDAKHRGALDVVSRFEQTVPAETQPELWVSTIDQVVECGAADLIRDRSSLYLEKTRNLGAVVLDKSAREAVGRGERPAPLSDLRIRIESCDLVTQRAMTLTYWVFVGETSLHTGQIDTRFDINSLPKDEVEELDVRDVLEGLLSGAAKQLADALRDVGRTSWLKQEALSAAERRDWAVAASRLAGLRRTDPDAAEDLELTLLSQLDAS